MWPSITAQDHWVDVDCTVAGKAFGRVIGNAFLHHPPMQPTAAERCCELVPLSASMASRVVTSPSLQVKGVAAYHLPITARIELGHNRLLCRF